jgi:hypothetical protein
MLRTTIIRAVGEGLYFCEKWVDFGNWMDRWMDKLDGHFLKTGWTLLGFSAYKRRYKQNTKIPE